MKNLKSFGQLNEDAATTKWSTAAANTEDAYSFDRYKAGEWQKVAKFLAEKGYTQQDIEDILNSKTMRWIADAANKADNMTASLFKKYFDANAEKAADDMIRRELKREPKSGKSAPNKQVDDFKSELTALKAKYKGKVSDADMVQVIKDNLAHKL